MTRLAKGLINLGIVVIPFVFWPGIEQFRLPKETVALSLCLFIGCVMLYSGGFTRFKNKWILAFVLWSLVGSYFAPQFDQFKLAYFINASDFKVILDKDITNFWTWKITSQVLIFFLLLLSVFSMHFRMREIKKTFYLIALVGLGMSVFVIIQWLGVDPIFKIENRNTDLAALSRPLLGGTIGHSTLVAPFIGMTIPFALYHRKWIWAGIMLFVLILTDSQVAQGAAVVSLGIFAILSCRTATHKKILASSLAMLIALGWFIFTEIPKSKELLNDSGRIGMWKSAFSDLKSMPRKDFKDQRKFTVQGFGPGAFTYYSRIVKGSRWDELHNEPLETLFNFGIVGFFVFLGFIGSIYFMLRKNWATLPNKPEVICILFSLIYISVASFGTFVWHIEPMRFYSVVLLGLLLNNRILTEKLI